MANYLVALVNRALETNAPSVIYSAFEGIKFPVEKISKVCQINLKHCVNSDLLAHYLMNNSNCQSQIKKYFEKFRDFTVNLCWDLIAKIAPCDGRNSRLCDTLFAGDCARLALRRAMNGKANNRFAIGESAKAARIARNVLVICCGANDDDITVGRCDFLFPLDIARKQRNHGTGLCFDQQIRMANVVSRKIYRETGVICRLNHFPIAEIIQHVVMGISETTLSLICPNKHVHCISINFTLVSGQITGLIVPPQNPLGQLVNCLAKDIPCHSRHAICHFFPVNCERTAVGIATTFLQWTIRWASLK